MRGLILFCLLFMGQHYPKNPPPIPHGGSGGNITYAGGAQSGASSYVAYTVGSLGDLLVLEVGCTNASASVTSVTDTSGDVGWTLAVSRAHTGTHPGAIFQYYLPNTGHVGSRVISTSMSSCGTEILLAHEYKMAVLTSPLDTTSANDGVSTTLSVTAFSPASAGEMVHYACIALGATVTISTPTSYVVRLSATGSTIDRFSFDRVVATTTEHPQSTIGTSTDWACVAGAYKPQ